MYKYYNRLSISNLFIVISFIATILVTIYPELYKFGINNSFLENGIYHIFILQFFTGMFLHGGLMHLLANSLFLYLFGNILELIMGKNKYILFFIFVGIFNGIMLSIYNVGNVIGISGFCMALISYYTLDLKFKNNPEYKGGITALIINIAIGFVPGVSLLGHLFGAIAGVLFFFISNDFFRRVLIGKFNYKKS